MRVHNHVERHMQDSFRRRDLLFNADTSILMEYVNVIQFTYSDRNSPGISHTQNQGVEV